jgi:hypothetical protein
MYHFKRPSAIIAAFAIAAVSLILYDHFVLLLISNSAQAVRVTALLPAEAAHVSDAEGQLL